MQWRDDTTLPTAALRDFSPLHVRYGSSATDMVKAARSSTSASPRKRTSERLPPFVRLVPEAAVSNRSKEQAIRSPRRRGRPTYPAHGGQTFGDLAVDHELEVYLASG